MRLEGLRSHLLPFAGWEYWEERLKLYAQAEQVLIDNASIVPMVHPVTMAVMSDQLGGDGSTPNSQGFTPMDRLGHYFFTHLTKK